MTDEVLRNYLGVLSFLLAALSFLAAERRGAIDALDASSSLTKSERAVAVGSTAALCAVAFCLVVTAVPALCATALEPGDVLRLAASVREAFVLAWFLLVAITVVLGALVVRACKLELGA